MDITNMANSADAVISCSKLKTHGMTLMTGCVKNLFGCVPGTTKVEYHARFNQLNRFSNMLVDIERCVRPVISVLDAVDGMEGEGPSGGTPSYRRAAGQPRRARAGLGGRAAYRAGAERRMHAGARHGTRYPRAEHHRIFRYL